MIRFIVLLIITQLMSFPSYAGSGKPSDQYEDLPLDPKTGLSTDGFNARQERRILTLETKIAEQGMEISRLQRDIQELQRDLRSIRR